MSVPMKIGSAQWYDILRRGGDAFGVDLNDDCLGRFGQHAAALRFWNRKTNLTAITDPREMAEKHYVDCLALVTHLPTKGHLLDIGSGAGFPGIPLAIVTPERVGTLIDGSRRKVGFLNYIIPMLGLANLEARHARAEQMARRGDSVPGYALIVSRALGSLAHFARLSLPLLPPGGGRLVAMKGRLENQEVEDFKWVASNELKQLNPHVERVTHQTVAYRLPASGARRSLVIIDVN